MRQSLMAPMSRLATVIAIWVVGPIPLGVFVGKCMKQPDLPP